MTEQIETAIEARDIGTAQELLNAMLAENKAAGLVTVYAPRPGSPESVRKNLLRQVRAITNEMDENTTDILTDSVTGTNWAYTYSDDNDTEHYTKI